MKKSPSSSRRLVRVMSRIAEERAFRGRTPTTSKPKTISGTIVDWSDEDDDGAGGPAEFAGFDFTPAFFDDGSYSFDVSTPAGYKSITVPLKAKNWLLDGIDWAEALPQASDENYLKKPKEPKVEKTDLDLIDILFPPTRTT